LKTGFLAGSWAGGAAGDGGAGLGGAAPGAPPGVFIMSIVPLNLGAAAPFRLKPHFVQAVAVSGFWVPQFGQNTPHLRRVLTRNGFQNGSAGSLHAPVDDSQAQDDRGSAKRFLGYFWGGVSLPISRGPWVLIRAIPGAMARMRMIPCLALGWGEVGPEGPRHDAMRLTPRGSEH
jgi:hypothetical protein